MPRKVNSTMSSHDPSHRATPRTWLPRSKTATGMALIGKLCVMQTISISREGFQILKFYLTMGLGPSLFFSKHLIPFHLS